MMKIPHRIKEKIRQKEDSLFYKPILPEKIRIKLFFNLMTELLSFIIPIRQSKGKEKDEVISEIYLISHELFRNFDPTKSSLILYLEKAIPWELSKLPEDESFDLDNDLEIEYENESDIINKLIAQKLSEKYYFLFKKIWEEGKTISHLSRECGMDRKTIKSLLTELGGLI